MPVEVERVAEEYTVLVVLPRLLHPDVVLEVVMVVALVDFPAPALAPSLPAITPMPRLTRPQPRTMSQNLNPAMLVGQVLGTLQVEDLVLVSIREMDSFMQPERAMPMDTGQDTVMGLSREIQPVAVVAV
jgi:hypothetical protein